MPKIIFSQLSILLFSIQLSLFSNLAHAETELSILGITLGKSTLEDVKTKFKSKAIYQEGEAGATLAVLCYKAPNGSTVAFESDEKKIAGKIVSSILINDRMQPYRLAKVCEKTSLIKSKLTINGTSTGMSPLLIKTKKGKPAQETPNSLMYQYEGASMTVEFKQDYAVSISASL